MEITFLNADYKELYLWNKKLWFDDKLIRSYQRKLQLIYAADSILDLYKYTSLHLEKLKWDKEWWMSIRLNKQWRLIIKQIKDGQYQVIWVKWIEDYH